jgi:hypothetical protein
MRRALKIFGALLLAVLALAGLYLAYEWKALSAFPGLPAAYEAKELCSCLFVEGRPQADCEAFVRQTVVAIDARRYDMDARTVEVRALWTTRRAHHESARTGCVLDP